MDYVELVGASLTMTNDGTAIDSVNISVTETKEKLKPLVTESYKYLKVVGIALAAYDWVDCMNLV